MSALARVGQRLVPMVRHVANSGNHIAPSMWKKFGSDLYDNIPRFLILTGVGAVTYVVTNFDERINKLENNLGGRIDRLENRIDASGKESRDAMGKLSDRLDGRIDASGKESREAINAFGKESREAIDAFGKESREAIGKLSDKIDSRIDASRKETSDKIDLQTKIILEVLNKRSWW